MNGSSFTLEELTNNSSFIRWAIGNADADEARWWNEWIEAGENNRQLALQAQQLITGFSFEAPVDIHRYRKEDWQQIKHQITTRKRAVGFRSSQTDKRNYLGAIPKVAAVLLIAALSGFMVLFMYQQPQAGHEQSVPVLTVSTDFSENKTMALSDGSEIILAAGSSLSYKEDWLNQPTLRVTLEKGEAFFSIQPDESGDRSIPRFEVQTEDGTTSVLGTKFSVTTYGDGTQVVLEQGEVRVTAAEPGEDHSSSVTLTPGKMAQWTKEEPGIALTDVNPRVYTSWTSGHLFFDDTPLSYLAERIERTYGVNVEVADPVLLDLKLSGAVDFHSLDALIYALSNVLDIRIRQVNDRVVIQK